MLNGTFSHNPWMRKMSASHTVKEFRIWSVLQNFGDSVFLTLTTPDVVDLSEIRRRWRNFRHDYFRSVSDARWVMCYEPHPHGHGWHIHCVIEKSFLPVCDIRHYAKRSGFGRIHVERVYGDMSKYVSKYITKVEFRVKENGCKRIRLVNISRGLSCLTDIVIKSAKLDYCRKCLKTPTFETAKMTDIEKWKVAELYLLFGSILFGHEINAWREFRLHCLSSYGDVGSTSELGFIEIGRGSNVTERIYDYRL